MTPYKVLVLCTGNSARSILGEVLLNEIGQGKFEAYSAGSNPVGRVDPGAIDKLRAQGHDVSGLRSKSWDEFTGSDAPELNLVITVCDNAAGETCPAWNGAPLTLHWSLPDPAAFEEEAERRAAFDDVYDELRSRIEALVKS
ncbi:MAG: arsenate reductase ArsC [Woeseiaceae bacterium]|nr:arsenate reductase ArsC [Woeseiaceae bacterium]